MCPKSSLSRSVSVKALQLTEMKGSSCLWDLSCRALATSSFPVPLSPWMRTVLSVDATRFTKSMTSWIL